MFVSSLLFSALWFCKPLSLSMSRPFNSPSSSSKDPNTIPFNFSKDSCTLSNTTSFALSSPCNSATFFLDSPSDNSSLLHFSFSSDSLFSSSTVISSFRLSRSFNCSHSEVNSLCFLSEAVISFSSSIADLCASRDELTDTLTSSLRFSISASRSLKAFSAVVSFTNSSFTLAFISSDTPFVKLLYRSLSCLILSS